MSGGIFALLGRFVRRRGGAFWAETQEPSGEHAVAEATSPEASARVFEFSLGPVQSWVGQARRTRDLWAGSFLLAWLSARAAAAALAQDEAGDAFFLLPQGLTGAGHRAGAGDAMVRLELLRRAAGEVEEGTALPLIGSMPNHFSIGIPPGVVFDPAPSVAAVYEGWWALADAVHETFIAPLDLPAERKAAVNDLWRTQIGSLNGETASGQGRVFWEVLWTMEPGEWRDTSGSAPKGPIDSLLARRKAWRDQRDPAMADGQASCALLPNWAEASAVRGWRGDAVRADFWRALRGRIATVAYGNPSFTTLDLRDGEMLSAIALVKRLFPVLPAHRIETVFGAIPGGPLPPADKGRDRACRDRLANWPSTAFVAAVPWIGAAWKTNAKACVEYQAAQQARMGILRMVAEAPTVPKIRVFPEAADTALAFAGMDGGLYQERSVRSYVKNREADGEPDPAIAQAYETFRNLLNDAGLRRGPSAYFALLKMDGDHVGRALGDDRLWHVMPKVLDAFSRRVADIVTAHQGLAIYAGGDDVLALLPVDKAIDAACALEAEWTRIFLLERSEVNNNADTDHIRCTMSAGLVFADYQVPLSRVRREADRLLDDVAKEGNNRNSIAISLLRRGGRGAQWTAAWRSCANPDECGERKLEDIPMPVRMLAELGDRFQRHPDLTQRFFYKVKERFGQLLSDGHIALPPETLHALLVAEFVERDLTADELDQAKRLMDNLLFVAQAHPQPGSNHPFWTLAAEPVRDSFSLDALWLIRFLAANCMPRGEHDRPA